MQIELLLREKPARLLLALRSADAAGMTISALAKASGMSLVHASNLISSLSNNGLLEVQRTGREKRVKLTPLGVEVASALDTLLAKLTIKKEPHAESTLPAPAATSTSSAQSQELEFPQPPPQEKKPEPAEPPSE
jgi:predicted transcriptional regulator